MDHVSREQPCLKYRYTAISRKVVGKSASDNPERYCGWFWVHCSSRKATKVGLTATLSGSVLIVSHITFQVCRVHFFRQPFSKYLYIRYTCIYRNGVLRSLSGELRNGALQIWRGVVCFSGDFTFCTNILNSISTPHKHSFSLLVMY